MNKKVLTLITLTTLLAFNTSYGQRFPVPPNTSSLVIDYLGILNLDERDLLEVKLLTFHDSTSVQIVVVSVDNLKDLDLDEYAKGLYHYWNIAMQEGQEGVLLLLHRKRTSAIPEVSVYAAGNLSDILPPSTRETIVKTEIEPWFKRGRYLTGMNRGTDAIMSIVTGEMTAEEYDSINKNTGGNKRTILVIVASLVLVTAVTLIFRKKESQK